MINYKRKINKIMGFFQRKISLKIYSILRAVIYQIIPKTRNKFKNFDIYKDRKLAVNFLKTYGYLKLKPIRDIKIKTLYDIEFSNFEKKSIVIPSSYYY